MNLAHDRRDGTLELIDVATKAPRALTVDRAGIAAPQWSPRGDAIAFIADDTAEHAQVFVLPLDGGDALAVTHAHGGVQQYAWRPTAAQSRT